MGLDLRKSRISILAVIFGVVVCRTAMATPYLVVNEKTGEVIAQHDATEPWYPASLTKLVSTYVALKAVREGRVTFDTPFVVSRLAASMPPSKMGFPPGTEVTLGNLLKMMLVKSANDLAVTLAEGLDGSVQRFADEMNATAASLGMTESHFVNPNGLPNPQHYSSARDLAIVARALLRDFPEDAGLFDIGEVKLGKRLIPTLNGLLGRYPGVSGMKTGFTCASGFNIIVSAKQGRREIIVVVLGYPTVRSRTIEAASLLNVGFDSPGTGVNITALRASPVTSPPNISQRVCGRHREIIAQHDFPIEIPAAPTAQDAASAKDANDASAMKSVSAFKLLFSRPGPQFEPLTVFLGPVPGWSGPVMRAQETSTSVQTATNREATPVGSRAERATTRRGKRVSKYVRHPLKARAALNLHPTRSGRYRHARARPAKVKLAKRLHHSRQPIPIEPHRSASHHVAMPDASRE